MPGKKGKLLLLLLLMLVVLVLLLLLLLVLMLLLLLLRHVVDSILWSVTREITEQTRVKSKNYG